ncbi:MAG: hypothetical protein RLZZ543_459 [Bacteroidota bacterium]|jgi:hypothetical protein
MASYASKKDLTSKARFDFNSSRIRENGRGFSVTMEALGKMPKRIALVSFYTDDQGITKVTGTNSMGKTYHTTNSGNDNLKIFGNRFYAVGMPAIKSAFQQYGIEILSPEEFLTDDTKRAAYRNFTVRHTVANQVGAKVGKFFKNMTNSGTTLESDEAADGFELLKINKRDQVDPKKKSVPMNNLSGSFDGQMIESIGYDLCNSLGVDAVLIVYNSQLADERWNKTRFWMSAVNMQLFGPNPLPLKEGKKDNNLYSKGLFYGGVRMAFKKGLLINPKEKDEAKKAIIEQQVNEAYVNMINGCVNRLGQFMEKELKKAKK